MELLGKLILIVGPSGSGKGTVISQLKKRYPGFVYPISFTTRLPRKGEKDGGVYHFISKEEFEKRIKNGDFLEYAIVHSNNYYGTSRSDILEPLENGSVVVREVDIQGFNSIKKLIPEKNLTSIFMRVSDREDLKRRILRRGKMTDEELERRMESTLKEIAQADKCEYQVENVWGQVNHCVNQVEKIILSEMKKLY